MGVIAVVLAVTALALRRRQPEVIAFGAVAIAMAAVVFFPPVISLLNRLPSVGAVLWGLALMPMIFAISILAGVGIDVFVRCRKEHTVRSWLGAGFTVRRGFLGLWAFGRGHLTSAEASIRARSFIWPVVQTALGLGVVGTLALVYRRNSQPRADARHWLAALLLACETAFLIAAAAPLWSSSQASLTPTPAVTALQRAVGSSIVGFGTTYAFPTGVGILPNVNDVYEVPELAAYDPMIPREYFRSLRAATGERAGTSSVVLRPRRAYARYCPSLRRRIRPRTHRNPRPTRRQLRHEDW